MEIGDMSDIDSTSDDGSWISAPSFQASFEPQTINPWDQPPFLNYINNMLSPITSSISILLQGYLEQSQGYIYHILNENHEQILRAVCRFNQLDTECRNEKKKCTVITVTENDEKAKMKIFLKSTLLTGNEVRVEAPPGVTIGWIKRKRFRREYKMYSSANPNKLELLVAKTKSVDKNISSMINQEVGDEDYVVVEEENGMKSIAGYLFTSVNFHDDESTEDLLACTFSKQTPSMSKLLIFSCLLLVDSEMFAK